MTSSPLSPTAAKPAASATTGATSAPVVVRWCGDQPWARQRALEQALQAHPGQNLLLLHSAQNVNRWQIQRWSEHLRHCPASVDGVTVLSNRDERYNPFSDHPHPPQPASRSGVTGLVQWLGDGDLKLAASFPGDRLLLRPQAAQRLARRDHWPSAHDPQLFGYQLQMVDDIYLDDPSLPLFHPRPAQRWQAAPSESFTRLSTELRRVMDHGITQLPLLDRPCLLHITHSWGGGVNRWLTDWCQYDHSHHQLILRSHGDWQRARHGSRLALYLYDPLRAETVLLRQFHLTPAITATRLHDAQYRAILDWISTRYPVQRILVSSLIGHSLDALNSDLPCIYALHDFYPAWPLLSVNPLPYRKTSDDGQVRYDLDQALQDHPQGEFAEDQVEQWQRLTQEWRKLCLSSNVCLTAPTASAADIIADFNPPLRDRIQVVPHGLPDWSHPRANPAQSPTATTRDISDDTRDPTQTDGEKLHLVVPGRLSRHKGRDLLCAALPQLSRYARITLLGCDRDGMLLLGTGGVNIIGRYHHRQLPQLMDTLQPDAALLLSIVPETFSYTLSEMWSLGIPPVATNLGGFSERIQSDINGLLIAPEPSALVAAVRRLQQERDLLPRMRQHIHNAPPTGMRHMLASYEQLWPQSGHQRQTPAALPLYGDLAELQRSHLWALDEHQQQLQQHRRMIHRAEAQTASVRHHLAHERRVFERQLQHHRDIIQRREDIIRQQQEKHHQLAQHIRQKQREINNLEDYLRQGQEHYAALQGQYQQILASRSWRLTRPLRIMTRSARNLRRARVHLPWRWPWLARRLLQSLFSQGLGGTFRRLQNEPATAAPAAIEDVVPSQSIRSIELRRPEQPILGVVVSLGDNLALLSSQLQQLARLQEHWPLVAVISGSPGPQAQAYLAQCTGLMYTDASHNEPISTTHSASGASSQVSDDHPEQRRNRRFPTDLAAAIASVKDAGLQVPQQWLLLDDKSEPLDSALEQLIKTLQTQPQACVVSGARVNHQRQILAPRITVAPRTRADHPLYCYVRTLPAPGVLPLAVDISRLGIDNETAVDQIDALVDSHRRQHGVLLQPLSQFLWLDSDDLGERPPLTESVNPNDGTTAQSPTVLVVDAWMPTPDQDSGSLRMVQLLHVTQSLGWHVVFCAADHSHRGQYTTALQSAGIEVWHTPYLKDFSGFLGEQGNRFSAVILSRYYVAQELLPLVRRHCPLSKIIFDTVDLHFLREEREAEVKQSGTLKRLAATTRKQELALVESCDTTLVVSPVEQQLLRQLRPLARVEVISNIHTLHGCHKDFKQRSDILFVGGFQHPPNVDAVRWFIAEVWPLIHQALPQVYFRVIGSKMPEEIKKLQAPNVEVLGFVPELSPYLHGCRISVAPLRYGAGVKGKVNSSMSYGQPVVATTIAVEGMALKDGVDVLVADKPQDFAAAVIRLYQDEQLWHQLSQAGLENIRRYFSVEAAQERLRVVLKTD